ncbi:hypothetical protein T439DRAFT_295394 [Meredithblackwellia eburnea MCA 4105]
MVHWCTPLVVLLAAGSTQAQSTQFGLPGNGLHKEGIHIGFLPDWSHEGPLDINRALGGGISVIGDYINVSPSNYQFAQIGWHLPEILQIARGDVRPIYAPAIIYGSTLDTWTTDMTTNLVSAVKNVNQRGITVWLRLLFEMNGAWMSYGLQQQNFLRIWKEVTLAVRAQTNQTFMLWSPNIWSGAVDDSSQGYTPYFPGQQYVDIAGLSFYSSGFNKCINQVSSTNLFKTLFTPFYNLLNPSNLNSSSSNPLQLTSRIPVVISETSAPVYYTLAPSSPYYNQAGDTDISGPLPNISTLTPSLASPPYPRSDDELYIKATWFVQLTSNVTSALFPNLICVSMFNYFKRGGDDGGAPVLVDFRAVGGNTSVEQFFRNSIGNQTAYDAGYESRGTKVHEVAVPLLVVLLLSSVLIL